MSNYPVRAFPVALELMKHKPALSCEDFHLRWQKHMVFQQVSNSPDFPPVGLRKIKPANSRLLKGAISVRFGDLSKGK